MVATATRLEIRDRARRRTNSGASLFWTDGQLDTDIDVSGQEWFDLVIKQWGADKFTKQIDFTTTADTEKYDITATIGADAYIIRALGIQESSNQEFFDMPRFNGPREYFQLKNQTVSGRVERTHFDVIGNDLYTLPEPSGGRTIRVFYIPTFTKFASDGATVNGVNGWEEYIVTDLCIKFRDSQRQDTGVLERQKASLTQRITDMSLDQVKGRAHRIISTRRVSAIRAYPGS